MQPSESLSNLKLILQSWRPADLALTLGVSTEDIKRWKKTEVVPERHAQTIELILSPSSDEHTDHQFSFIDLFAGIGGIRLAFESIGGECIFTSEWDEYAQKTYGSNHISGHQINGDITKVDANSIPDHDVLLAGFPCQPFSIAGVSKKNSMGRTHGFEDETQGTLFFDVARIIKAKRPKGFLLENVKNLVSHDQGRTFAIITKTLRDELGYHVHHKVINSSHFRPQNRERIIIVGFREAVDFDWDAVPLPEKNTIRLGSVLHKADGSEPFLPWDGHRYFDHASRSVLPKYTLTPKLWAFLQNYAAKHKAKGNGFGYGLVDENSVTRTLSARYYKDGSEILVDQGDGRNPRRLTPRECARLMGLPDSFRIPVSDTRAYKQFGNSVVVDVIKHAAELMKSHLS